MSPSPRLPRSKVTKPAPPAPPAIAPTDEQVAQKRLAAIKREMARGDEVDLTELHDVFELLRDATDQPARLFDLAVDEAELLEAVGPRARDELVTALLRVLEGVSDGVRARGVAFACERLEKHLRSAAGRAMDPGSQSRALAAVVNGRVLAGDVRSAGTAAARWIKWAEKYAHEHSEGGGEYVRALVRGIEIAATADDDAMALRWARARAVAVSEHAASLERTALADALATVATLLASAGDPVPTKLAAGEWLTAERELASMRDETMRADRRIAALGLVAAAAAASGAVDEWASAVEERVQLARAEFDSAASDELRGFAAGVLAESLRDVVEVQASRGDLDLALAAAREWLELETRLGVDGIAGMAGALTLNATLTAQIGDWESCLAASDRLLLLPPIAALRATGRQKARTATSTKPRSRKPKPESRGAAGDDWRPIRDAALSFAARAHYARSEYESAARYAREGLSDLAASLADEGPAAERLATTLVILAQSDEAVVRVTRPEAAPRDWQTFRAQARKMLAAVDALPRERSDIVLRCASLAWLAYADALTGSDAVVAQRHADEAHRKLLPLAAVPREVAAYVAFVHEITRPAGGRKSTGVSHDPLIASARALAASVSADAARAGLHLAAIDTEALASQPDALAHTLAAGTRILSDLGPHARERATSEKAWREVAPYASLLAARPPL